MRIALVGNQASGRALVAGHMRVAHNYKLVRMLGGVEKIYRTFFHSEKYARVPWETRLRMYDAMYEIDPTIWTRHIEMRLETTVRDVVIPDVRYLSEVERLREIGFLIIRVTTMDYKKRHIGKTLLDAKTGTLVLAENFNSKAVKVDYALTHEERFATKRMVDYMMEQLHREHKTVYTIPSP